MRILDFQNFQKLKKEKSQSSQNMNLTYFKTHILSFPVAH